jgi:hypothetical protein
LQLWTRYRVEIARELSDATGVSMVDDVSFGFQVRDGAWSVTSLAQGEAFQLPVSLPVATSGAALATWLTKQGSQCSASGAWVLRGQTRLNEFFAPPASDGDCGQISASAAPDDSAAAAWVVGKTEWSQSFAAGSWAPTERQTGEVFDAVIDDTRVFAHDAQQITIFRDTNGKSGYLRSLEQGAARDAWSPARQTLWGGSRIQLVKAADGAAFATWSREAGIELIAYDPGRGAWEDDSTTLPGTDSGSSERSMPNLAITPSGDALVLWVEGTGDQQALKSTRFTPKLGWDDAPTTVSTDLSENPLLDAPALVFDGRSFVGAWTRSDGGTLATYTARYDLDSGRWQVDAPRLSALGESAAFMPRLGVDSHGNLMLLWPLAGNPITLAYQRYRAETDTWGTIQPIDGVSFTDSSFASAGKLPFGFSPSGLASVLFRSGAIGSQTLKLAQFF